MIINKWRYNNEFYHFNPNHDPRNGQFTSLKSWKQKEIIGIDKRYDKTIADYDRRANKVKQKYETTGKERYSRKYSTYNTRANFERGMKAAEKQFVRKATYEDMKREKRKIAKGYAIGAAIYAAGNITLAAAGIPFVVAPLPKAIASKSSDIKRTNRVDSKTADGIYKNAQKKQSGIKLKTNNIYNGLTKEQEGTYYALWTVDPDAAERYAKKIVEEKRR